MFLIHMSSGYNIDNNKFCIHSNHSAKKAAHHHHKQATRHLLHLTHKIMVIALTHGGVEDANRKARTPDMARSITVDGQVVTGPDMIFRKGYFDYHINFTFGFHRCATTVIWLPLIRL